MKQKVVLLNPPGRQNYGRDYFCSKINKADYVEHPVDLLYLTGVLGEAGVAFIVIDAIVDKLSEEEVERRIQVEKPSHIVFLSGWVSWREDFVFLQRLKSQLDSVCLIGMGDLFLDKKIFLTANWIDSILYDFTNHDLLNYLKSDHEKIKNMLFRFENTVIDKKLGKNQDKDSYSLPIPRHDLFLNKHYTFPFARNPRFLTVLTDFGCPFSCSFCVYSEIGYKKSGLESVFKELRQIKALGVQEIFIKDQTFCISEPRGVELCQFMLDEDMKFSWTCFLRVTQANKEFLTLMKKAGCHTIIFGVETGDQSQLDEFLKGTSVDQIREAVENCRVVGIESVCTFILGFPDETEESIQQTIDFSVELNPTYAAFNTYVRKTEALGFDPNLETNHDQSGILDSPKEGNGVVSGERIGVLRKKAVARFYLRPNYFFTQIFRKQSLSEFKNKFRGFKFLIKNI